MKPEKRERRENGCISKVENYGVPLGPLAISRLALLFKNKNARFSHENLKPVGNLLVLKNAMLENSRLRGRGSESATAREKSRFSLPRPRNRGSRSRVVPTEHHRES